MSDDLQHSLTLIAFVGSVFSPYYRWARRGERLADPQNHCAINVALYGRGGRWAMTERGRRHNHRDSSSFVVGPSRLDWDGQCLHMRLNEISVPWLRPLKGHIRLWPEQLLNYSVPLDAAGRHRWGPLAPMARIEVDLSQPNLKWQGHAYLDSNEGDEPLEDAFNLWDWSRTHHPDGSTEVTYDLHGPDREDRLLRLRFDPQGRVDALDPVPAQALPRTAWRIPRRARFTDRPELAHQLEDTPFYQRCVLSRPALGAHAHTFHESLSMPRFVSPVVQAMLPWRMPRRS
jgi:carotenoid 1,2-hydratase